MLVTQNQNLLVKPSIMNVHNEALNELMGPVRMYRCPRHADYPQTHRHHHRCRTDTDIRTGGPNITLTDLKKN